MENFNDYEYQIQRFQKNIEKLTPEDKDFVDRAYETAKDYHRDQLRDDGVPYFIHPLRVANSLIEELNILEKEVLAATLFHDTVEDTAMALQDIIDEFTQTTADLVDNLTRDHEGDTEDNKFQRKLNKIQAIMNKDFHTRAIKATDILDNMRSWIFIPEDNPTREKFPRWFEEVETMNVPLADSVDEKLVQEMRRALERAKKLI